MLTFEVGFGGSDRTCWLAFGGATDCVDAAVQPAFNMFVLHVSVWAGFNRAHWLFSSLGRIGGVGHVGRGA